MSDMITRCPKCGTAFHITEAHLRSANGSVRCGSCLSVFNGEKHLTRPLRKTPAPEEDLLISDDMEIEENDQEEQLPVRENAVQDGQRIERRRRPREPEEDVVDEDESWALKLLEEEGHTPEQVGLASTTEEPKTTIQESNTTKKAKTTQESTGSPNAESENATQDEMCEHTQQLIEDLQDNELIADTSSNGSQAKDPEIENEERSTEAYEDADTADLHEEKPPLLAAFEPEPLEVEIKKERRFWSHPALWLLLTLLAIIGLAAQLSIYYFESLSRQMPYRNWYAIACEHLQCKLPPITDRTAIRTSNLVVRSHPHTPDALLVDVILRNTAPFEQTFPNINLTFRDLSDKVVASRSFNPKEYLGGELAGRETMPINNPIHIALEIVDPGNGAVSYNVTISD